MMKPNHVLREGDKVKCIDCEAVTHPDFPITKEMTLTVAQLYPGTLPYVCFVEQPDLGDKQIWFHSRYFEKVEE
jgi:hypothetical protein